MKIFTAPAWLKKPLSDGNFTYTPVPHPDPTEDTCSGQIVVSDNTSISPDPAAWSLQTETDGTQSYVLLNHDINASIPGMLTLSQSGMLTLSSQDVTGRCSGTCTSGMCRSADSELEGGATLTACSCSG